MIQPFRITPKLPPEALKTYGIMAPKETHFRRASCKEVDCPRYANGWKTIVDLSTDLGVKQARYIREHSGRKYTVTKEGELATFVFGPEQQCFTPHSVPLEREPLYVVRGGDWRGNPRGTPTVRRGAADWVDDFANHQDQISRKIEKG